MRRFALAGLIGFGVVVAALPTASAVARAPAAELSLSGSKGYSVFIEGSGRSVSLVALGLRPVGLALYQTRGRVSEDGIQVRFGNLGRIKADFKPSGRIKRRRPPRRCQGKPRKKVFGVFVGKIRFRGEEGYTRISTNRAKGSVTYSPRWKCKGKPRGAGNLPSFPGEADGDELTVLEATAARSRRSFSVSAWRPPEEHGLTTFGATSSERRGSMRVERFAIASGRERTFVFDSALGSATVAPPPPFSGTATFLLNPDGTTSWVGSLKVDFPGAEDVSLANQTYTARLYRP